VTKTTNNPGVTLLDSTFSEADTEVIVGVGEQRARWRCIGYSDGTTAGITSLTVEGTLSEKQRPGAPQKGLPPGRRLHENDSLLSPRGRPETVTTALTCSFAHFPGAEGVQTESTLIPNGLLS